jgi:hypothetical protein
VIGECYVSQVGGKIRVERADPEILIAVSLLDEIAAGRGAEHVSLEGDAFTIRGTNRTVIYDLGELTDDGHARHARLRTSLGSARSRAT